MTHTYSAFPHFVAQNISLFHKNTLALEASAAFCARITDEAQMAHFVGLDLPRFILGSGSNLVLVEDFEGIVFEIKTKGKAIVAEDENYVFVEAKAGENWHDFVCWTLQNGLGGLENLSLIPGTVGAAPIQNIGAYGVELCEHLLFVDALEIKTGQTMRLSKSQCAFGYRDSLFKQENWHKTGDVLVTSVRFALPKKWTATLQYAELHNELLAQGKDLKRLAPSDVSEAVIAIRTRKLPDPKTLPNVGSFFQNPIVSCEVFHKIAARYPDVPHYKEGENTQKVKLAAGWLIEKCGLKGVHFGPLRMYEKQALILVNEGGATGKDVLSLTKIVQNAVRSHFGVFLTPEPVFCTIKNHTR